MILAEEFKALDSKTTKVINTLLLFTPGNISIKVHRTINNKSRRIEPNAVIGKKGTNISSRLMKKIRLKKLYLTGIYHLIFIQITHCAQKTSSSVFPHT